jgi:hypothetical protein
MINGDPRAPLDLALLLRETLSELISGGLLLSGIVRDAAVE